MSTTYPAPTDSIIPLLPYQREDVESPARFRWNCWARQTGKSFTKSLRRILRGLHRRRTQVFLSAGERQSRELMAKARQHCQALKIATDYYDQKCFRGMSLKQLEIILPGGVRIIGLPANPETARGFTGDVLLDEFAMHGDDRAIWAAMFPTLLRGDGELDIASTPKGRGNMFDLLQHNERFSTCVVTLPDAIAQGLAVDAEEVRSAMGDDELYRQEFLCEFLDESTAFMTYDQIRACVDPSIVPTDDPSDLQRVQSDLYLGVDIGRRRDLTVMWVWAREGSALVLRGLLERRGAPFREQYDLLCQYMALPRLRGCCIDSGGLGMQMAEQAEEKFGASRVECVNFTPALKSQMATALRIAVEGREVRIVQDEQLIEDWHSVRRTVSEAGHFLLQASTTGGSHADRFWAAALALRSAQQHTSAPMEMQLRGEAHFTRGGLW
jgi:phage FluMu gp28-like protein